MRPPRPIDASAQRIRPCEQRLALSASFASDFLLDSFAPLIPSGPDSDPSDSSIEAAQPAQTDLADAGVLDGGGQTVAVIDSGIAWDHEVFRGQNGSGFGPGYRVVGGWDFAEDDANPYDDGPAGFHGTHVAGLLAGRSTGENETIVGVAPGADLVALRVFDDDGRGQLQWIESALRWVHDNKDTFESPITTVNLSVGALLDEENLVDAKSMLEDELQQLRDDNILVFAAAGNGFDSSGGDAIMYPASSPLVQAVTSIHADGGLSEFAQRSPGILSTQGEAISSSVPDHVFGWDGRVNDMASLDGTSMATPQVAAASMLLRQSMIADGMDPTADEIMRQLRESSQQRIDPVTGDPYRVVDIEAMFARDPRPSAFGNGEIGRYDGDNDSQHVTLDLTDGIRLTVDGTEYPMVPGGNMPLVIDVGGGADSLRVFGSEQAERVVLDPVDQANNRISTNEYEIRLRGFEEVVFDGGGGRDRATLYDARGDETFQSHPGRATLEGIGFRFEIHQVDRVYAHATAGGDDTAFVRDSAGDDELNVRPQFTSLRSESGFQLAYGFESVFAYATSGGSDTAELYDSAGDDVMSISATRSIITGVGYQVSARGFDAVSAYATGGGDDLAKIYADHGENQWVTTGEMTQWTQADTDKVHVARGFEQTRLFEDLQELSLMTQSASPAEERDAMRRVFRSLGES